jgi:hypothetical protein
VKPAVIRILGIVPRLRRPGFSCARSGPRTALCRPRRGSCRSAPR